MVYRSSRRQAQSEGEPEGFGLQEISFSPDMDKVEKSRRQIGRWRAAALFLAVIVIALVITVIILASKKQAGTSLPTCGTSSTADYARLKNKNTIDRSEPKVPGPFHDLTKYEMKKVRLFLEKDPNIKAVKAEVSKIDQSVIYTMDLYLPEKTDVINYLDNNGDQPARKARVMVFRGDLAPPMVHEYICGPLPDVQSCEMSKNPKRRNPVEFSLRPLGLLEFEALYEHILTMVDKKIGYILKESYGTAYVDCKPQDCLKFYPSPMGTNLVNNSSMRRLWMSALYPVEYYGLQPVDFTLLAVLDGSNPSDYRVDKVWYHGAMYDSLDHLIQIYNTLGPKMKSHLKKPSNPHLLPTSLYLRGDPLPEQPQRPPTLVEPDGNRYSLKDRKVEYLGWSFHFRMSTLTGPSLYDIRYKNERIAYELGMAEIAVFYSGDNPGQRSTDYVDSGVLIGTHSKSLVPGGDCPETATFINQSFSGQSVSKPVELARAFCLFENNNGHPLRRHLSYSKSEGAFYGGMLDSALTLRSAITVVNYDYIMDFIFHQNGVIETRVMSTGYILGQFYRKAEDAYGFEIAKNLIGNVHHHMFHFKADLDIGGTSNRYETLDIVPEVVNMRSVPNKQYHQQRYVRSLKSSEMAALYKYDFEKPKYHVVHNNAKNTTYGALKGYRIALNGMSKSLIPEDNNNEGTISWSRHQMVVTKQKHEEMVSSSPYAMWDSFNPVTNFTHFYRDNENIVDEDLVFWITEGMHHIPHTEDLPLTPTVGNHLSFFLLPYNYFDECPSVASRDHIRIEHKDKANPKKGVHVIRNGNSKDQCITPNYAQQYDDLLEEDPDVILETLHSLGIF